MKMTAKNRTKDVTKHRKAVLREMKNLSKRIAKHARKHLDLLTTRSHETDLTPGQTEQISQRIQGILDQLPAAIKQAHERIIGGRKLPNKDKILSLYDPDVQVIVRGKSNAEVEFGNNLWLGETRSRLTPTGQGRLTNQKASVRETEVLPCLGIREKSPKRRKGRQIHQKWRDRRLNRSPSDPGIKSADI